MSENLKVDASHKVLEIGTGSGYQSAVLSNLSNHVHTIEIIDELAKEASSRLNELGYNNITVHCGDGYKGLPEEAPFDRIMVTAAPKEIPEILVEQLSEGGMMILPMGEEFDIQHLWVVTKEGDGSIKKEKVLPVRFVPMVKK
jgi:protein-L-isoaspartate(D-aspartate) O-methyltransferase